MSVKIDLQELLAAYEWVSGAGAAMLDCKAFINRVSGQIYWVGEGVEEEVPEDIEDGGEQYIAVPDKHDFDLARPLVFRFVEEHAPESIEAVHEIFRRAGAYGRFKLLLERVGKLQAWYKYEKEATEQALREWCEENHLTLA